MTCIKCSREMFVVSRSGENDRETGEVKKEIKYKCECGNEKTEGYKYKRYPHVEDITVL